MPVFGGSRAAWVDPAPLEVSRPRLPWWLLGPRKGLLIVLPVLAVVGVVWLAVQLARRVYRYPLTAAVIAWTVVAWVVWGWLVALIVVGSVVESAAVWWWLHRSSFDRVLGAQLVAEWRRAVIYGPRWHRVMLFSDLAKTHGSRTGGGTRTYVPTIARVRSDGWRDRIVVKLLAGQAPVHFEERAEALAHSFGARSCRVRVIKPRRIVVDLVHSDPLAEPMAPPDLPELPVGIDEHDSGTSVDLRRVVIGRTESGRPARLRLLANHVLVVGSMGAGKGSVAWSVVWSLAAAIRAGQVLVFGIDPKGGMELGRAPALFHRLAFGNDDTAVTLLEDVAALTRQRANELREANRRAWRPGQGTPFVLLVVDELADLIAYQPDRKLRDRANAALQTIVSQGRAPGVAVLAQVQDPRKNVVDFRHLFPTRLALRLDEPTQVDMVLGDGVRERGAAAHDIPESTPGVAWAKDDGRREPVRLRAFHVTDGHLDDLTAYITHGAAAGVPIVRQLPMREAA